MQANLKSQNNYLIFHTFSHHKLSDFVSFSFLVSCKLKFCHGNSFCRKWLRIKIFLSIVQSRFTIEMDFEMQLSMAGIHPDLVQEKRLSNRAVGVSRRDTIIIAMLVNIALLAVLFATATRKTEIALPVKLEPVIAKVDSVSQVAKPAAILPQTKAPVDEIDELLKSYAIKTQPSVAPKVVEAAPQVKTCDVIVKKGDVLSRIAKKHNVKVEDIIVLNNLQSANLKVGQTLKVPSQAVASEFYVVQDGDSPWKIAKKCRISVEELLRLNSLDEDKAKNLKIGQKLKIR